MDLEGLADDAKKENIIAVVTQMSKVDNKIHENELVYLLKLGLSLGLSDEKVREIISSDDKFLFVPKSEPERVTILYYLIFLIEIDGVVEKNEEDLLYHFGLKLGFNPLLISNVINIVKSKSGNIIAHHSLLDELKTYLN